MGAAMGSGYPSAAAGAMGHHHQFYSPAAVGSMEMAPLKLPPKNAGKKKPNFAEKLLSVLANPMVQPIMHWLPSGKSFCIANQKMFNDEVLPKYFREAKYESFLRRMKRWGFQRIGTAEAAGGNTATIYACELFQRDKPELCKFMCDERRWKKKPLSGGMMMMGGMGGPADMSMGGVPGGMAAMGAGGAMAGAGGIPNQFYGGGPGGMLTSLQEEGAGGEEGREQGQQGQMLPPTAATPGQFLQGAGAGGAQYPHAAAAELKPSANAAARPHAGGMPFPYGTPGAAHPTSGPNSNPGSSGSVSSSESKASPGQFNSHLAPTRANDSKGDLSSQQPSPSGQTGTDAKGNNWDVSSQIDDDIKDCEEKLFLLNQLKVLKDKRRSLIENRSGSSGPGQNPTSGGNGSTAPPPF